MILCCLHEKEKAETVQLLCSHDQANSLWAYIPAKDSLSKEENKK